MKQTKYLIILVIISFTCLMNLSAQEQVKTDSDKTGNMIVRILGLSSDNGVVMISLNNSKECYNGPQPFQGGTASIKEGKAEFVFENIPFGEYAIKCYHDENSNGKMDSNMMGIPKEAYGFSNNAKGNFGPARYEDAKFIYSEHNQVVELEIQ